MLTVQYKKIHTDSLSRNGRAWEARRILQTFANLRDPYKDEKVIEWLRQNFPRVIRPIDGPSVKYYVANVRHFLKQAWSTKKVRERDWLLIRVRMLYADGCKTAALASFLGPLTQHTFPGIPEGDEAIFDSALFYAQQKLADKMQVCKANCSTPYFFRSYDKKQGYCCTDCRDTARDAGQKRYWARKGKYRRTERRKRQKSLR